MSRGPWDPFIEASFQFAQQLASPPRPLLLAIFPSVVAAPGAAASTPEWSIYPYVLRKLYRTHPAAIVLRQQQLTPFLPY